MALVTRLIAGIFQLAETATHSAVPLKFCHDHADLLSMSMFGWKDTYNIGVPEIDAQHRRLFSLADELHAAMNSGKGKSVLEGVLKNLIVYTKTHFSAEESLMQRCKYPNFAAHKAQHDEMTQKVLQLQRDFHAGNAIISIDVMQFLAAWLRQHIGDSDRKYAPFVNNAAGLITRSPTAVPSPPHAGRG
jgi:hemerythrin